MAQDIEYIKLSNKIGILRVSVEPDSPEEQCAVRSLLWGVSGECEILGPPPGLIPSGCSDSDLADIIHKRESYFDRLIAAIVGFSNTFGGRIFLSVQDKGEKQFPEKVYLPDMKSYNLPSLISGGELKPGVIDAIKSCIDSIDLTLLGYNGPFKDKPDEKQKAAAEGKLLALADCFNMDNLDIHWYNTIYGRKLRMSIQQCLNDRWVSLNSIQGIDKEIYYFKVESMENGEVSHKLYNRGNLMFRIDRECRKRDNLVGINWSIFQSQRTYQDIKHEDSDGPEWPIDRSDPAFVYENFCYIEKRPTWYERLTHRDNLIEFFQTLSLERRSQLAQDLTEMIWKNFGGSDGANLYRDALRRLELAEISSKHLNADYQRDHVIHSCNVFFLGSYLWQSSGIIRERMETVPEAREARAIWAMAATWHDVGYPFELFLWTLQDELRLFGTVSTTDLLPVLQTELDKKAKGIFSDTFWVRIGNELDRSANEIRDQFNLKIQAIGIMNHGIVSAFLLERLAERLYLSKQWEPEFINKVVSKAAPVIAAHDIDIADKAKKFLLEKHPLAYLMILCDMLQEWDRSAVLRHILIPSGVSIKVIAGDNHNEEIVANMTVDSDRAVKIDRDLSSKLSHREKLEEDKPSLRLKVEAYSATLGFLQKEVENIKASTHEVFKEPEFLPFGTQLEPQQDVLVLDVGGKLTYGIIDHHQIDAPKGECASSLVFKHKELILDHLKSCPIGKVKFVMHSNPDFDCICSAFLARRLLIHGDIPPIWKPLVEYARQVDTATLKLDEKTITRSPYAFVCAISELWKSNKGKLERGIALMQYLAKWLEDKHTLEDEDLFAGRQPFEEEQAFIRNDYDSYLYDISRTRVEEIELPLLYGKGSRIVDLAIIELPRSRMYKVWARMDRQHSPKKQGFTATVVHRITGTDKSNWCIISTDPSLPKDEIVSIAGLGEEIIKLEDKKREERGIEAIPKEPRRAGYPNSDPWFDGRGSSHNFTIVDSPGRKSVLTVDEINCLVLQPEKWRKYDAEQYLKELVVKYGEPKDR